MSMFGLDGGAFNPLGNYKTALYAIAARGSMESLWYNNDHLSGRSADGVDESLLEAGRIDGCTEWQLFRKIKLPLISSTVTINIILSVISGLKAFDYSFIMTNGGPGKSTKTLMFQVYETAFTDMKMGRASAFSVLAFAFIIVITVCMLLYMNKREVEL